MTRPTPAGIVAVHSGDRGVGMTSGNAVLPAGPADLHAISRIVADGLVLLDGLRRVLWLDQEAADLLGVPAASVVNRAWPYDVVETGDGDWQRLAGPTARPGLQYRAARIGADGGPLLVLAIAEAVEPPRQQRRLAAIARAASSVADAGRLSATLDALAQAVFESTGLAAVQILILDRAAGGLRMMGEAGFFDSDDFGARLEDCRRLGAEFKMLEAAERCHPVVVPHRKPHIMSDPKWAPLHAIMGAVDWDSFVSMPLVAREVCVGVLNAFFAPDEDPGPAELEFLTAVADQAALAVDYAGLLGASRAEARREERQRLARDLHDSVVQRVFSMRMQATALRARINQAAPTVGADLAPIADELLELSRTALADLRDLIFELRPAELADTGLLEVLRVHATATETRTGMRILIEAPESLPEVPTETQEDLYRIVQEALQNVVKHAAASTARVRLRAVGRAGEDLEIEVADDGRGSPGDPAGGLGMGLVSMRERAARWGGALEAGFRAAGGFRVRATFPGLLTTGADRAEAIS